mmetsp:Transcript_123178/g.394527  ORF Transcript_123178/g.394527 Transcript_123178/m.394527 type:complete len:280 (-) Transcript_123178:572-1411(-)
MLPVEGALEALPRASVRRLARGALLGKALPDQSTLHWWASVQTCLPAPMSQRRPGPSCRPASAAAPRTPAPPPSPAAAWRVPGRPRRVALRRSCLAMATRCRGGAMWRGFKERFACWKPSSPHPCTPSCACSSADQWPVSRPQPLRSPLRWLQGPLPPVLSAPLALQRQSPRRCRAPCAWASASRASTVAMPRRRCDSCCCNGMCWRPCGPSARSSFVSPTRSCLPPSRPCPSTREARGSLHCRSSQVAETICASGPSSFWPSRRLGPRCSQQRPHRLS